MAHKGPPLSPRQSAEARFAASQRHDAQFMRERKEKEAANIARTRELKAQRLAKEALDRANGVPAPKAGRKKVAES